MFKGRLARNLMAATAFAVAAFLSGCVAFNPAGRPVGIQEGITSRVIDPMTLEVIEEPDIPTYPPGVPPVLIAD